MPARLRDTIKSYWPDSPDDSARNQWAHFADVSETQARDDVVEVIDLIARGRMGAEADGLAVDNERIDQHLARLENIRRALDFQISGH